MILTKTEKEEVRQMYYSGMHQDDIAKEKGISRRYVDAIIRSRDMGYDYRMPSVSKSPAGKITFEMIGVVKNQLRIGDTVLVDTVNEEGGYTFNRVKECPVLGKYKHIFTVQVGKCVSAFRYVGLIMKNGVRIGG